MGKKDDKAKEHVDHSGSTAAEDEELSLAINRLWARNEPPERIELWQVSGPRRDIRGEMIFHADFPAGVKRNVEQNNKLANEIMAEAQHDCDCVRKESSYQLVVIDRNRKSSPLVRRVGPLQPKRSFALARNGNHDHGADIEEDELTIKKLEFDHIKANYEESRWEKQHNARVIGELLLLMRDDVLENRTFTKDLMGQVMSLFRSNEEAQSQKAQRDALLRREEFKIQLWEEGVRTARNLLPGLFGPAPVAPANALTPPSDSNGGSAPSAPTNYGHSNERVLVDNFLTDCERAKIDIKLFGDCEIREGKMVQATPGIFSLKQFYILAGVRGGHLPAHELDKLMPGAKNENGEPLETAITPDQIKAGADAGVTEGIGSALLEILGLRRRAHAEAAARNQPPLQPTPPTDSPSA